MKICTCIIRVIIKTSIVFKLILTHTFLQTLRPNALPNSGFNFECKVSLDSIMDYKKYAIPSKGNFLYSSATAESTMDFSKKPIDYGIVDSHPTQCCDMQLLMLLLFYDLGSFLPPFDPILQMTKVCNVSCIMEMYVLLGPKQYDFLSVAT